MNQHYTPFVFWGQRSDFIFLTVDLREVQKPDIKMTENSLTFEATGYGARGHHLYSFHIEFYMPVVKNDSQFKVTGQNVELRLKKSEEASEPWPRLTINQQKYPWLKIDFDRMMVDSDESDRERPWDEQDPQLQRLLESVPKKQSYDNKNTIKLYLASYYSLQVAVNAVIFILLTYRFFFYGFNNSGKSVAYCVSAMSVMTIVSVCELVNSYMNLTKDPLIFLLYQVIHRNFELVLISLSDSHLVDTPVAFFIISNWSFLDIVKYAHNLMKLFNLETKMLAWLSNTLWIPLYPLSFLLTGIITMITIAVYEKNDRFSLNLPNPANVSFHFPLLLKAYLILTLIGMYYSLRHLYTERKRFKVTQEARKKSTKKKN